MPRRKSYPINHLSNAYDKIEESFEVGISDSFGGLLLTFGETVQK
jgi:hypothetical protein